MESVCALIRTVGSNPTLSANLVLRRDVDWKDALMWVFLPLDGLYCCSRGIPAAVLAH